MSPLYKMSRIGKLIETAGRLEVTGAGEKGRVGSCGLMVSVSI